MRGGGVFRAAAIALAVGTLAFGCRNPEATPEPSVEPVVNPGRPARRSGEPATPAPRPTTFVPPPTKTPGGSSAGTPTPKVSMTPIPSPQPVPSLRPGEIGLLIGGGGLTLWNDGPPLVRPRFGLAAGVAGDDLVAAEGDHRPSLEVYDAKTDTWRLDGRHDVTFNPIVGKTQSKTVKHHGHYFMAFGAHKTNLWVAGGHEGETNSSNQGGEVFLHAYNGTDGYQYSTEKAADGDPPAYMLDKGTRAAAGGVIDGKFYCAGGYRKDGQVLGDLQVIDLDKPPAGNVGTPPAMPVPVAGATAAVLRGKLYVIGGYDFKDGKPNALDVVQIFDPKTNKWTQAGKDGEVTEKYPIAVHGAGAAVLEGDLYVAGGFGADGKPVKDFYFLDATNGKWRQSVPLPAPRGLLALASHRNAIWAIGGLDEAGRPTRSVMVYPVRRPPVDAEETP